MRIDKFLWSVRIYKTRSIAAKACQAGRVKLNDLPAKPAKNIMPGDEVSVKKGPAELRFKVIALLKSRVGAKLVQDYIIDITPPEEWAKLDNQKYGYGVYRPRGTGRPTKKERRAIKGFLPGPGDTAWDWEGWEEE